MSDGNPPEYYPLRWKVADAAEDLWALHRAKMLVLLLVLLLAGGGAWAAFGRDGGDVETTDGDTPTDTTAQASDSPTGLEDDNSDQDGNTDSDTADDSTTVAPTTSEAVTTTTSSTTSSTTTSSTTSTTTTTVSPRTADAATIAATEPGAILDLTNSQVTLIGGVPTDAVADETLTLARAIFDGTEIVDEQIVDDSFPAPDVVTLRLSAADLFGYNSDQLNPTYTPLIDKIAAAMVAADTWQVEVSGHTDDTGPSDGNQRLSEGRAESAAARLRAQGVGSERITVVGRGEDQPVADNGTEAGRLANRRVEFAITR